MINVDLPDWELRPDESFESLLEDTDALLPTKPDCVDVAEQVYKCHVDGEEEVPVQNFFVDKVCIIRDIPETPYGYIMKKSDDTLFLNLSDNIQEYRLSGFILLITNAYTIHYYNRTNIQSAIIVKEYYNYLYKI